MNGFQPPYGRRFWDDLRANQAHPPMSQLDMQRLYAEGLLPPEFYEGSEGSGIDLSEIGRPTSSAYRLFEDDARTGTTLPTTVEQDIARRGNLGDSFRGLPALNIGRGAVIEAGDTGVLIVEARGLDCLTPVGLTLGYNIQGQILDTDDVFLQAHVLWGVGGAEHECVVDVGRGTQLRLPAASFVRVFMDYTPDQSTTPPRTGPDVMGIALLGYGTPSFRPSPARFTQRLASIDHGNSSSVVPIPKFAQSFGVIGEAASIASWTATLLPETTNDGNGHKATVVLSDGQMESQFFIPNGFRAIQLTNGSDGTDQAAQIVYTIML